MSSYGKSVKMILWSLLCIFDLTIGESIITDSHPDTYLSMSQLTEKYGYTLETYTVTTEDGYILDILRIPHGKNSDVANKGPIFLMHGLYGQAENYIINGMHNGSIAYHLADNGYDVWMGNSRGTQNGRKHVTLNPEEKLFWNFSWHEIGMYDLPAMIDFILMKTNRQQIFYSGLSQGGTAFYVMASMKPEYQKKIKFAVLMAPAAFFNKSKSSVLRIIGQLSHQLEDFFEKYHLQEVLNGENQFSNLYFALCVNSYLGSICPEIFSTMINGAFMGDIDWAMFPLMLRFMPGVSSKQLMHFAQGLNSGHFAQWDYGSKEKNHQKYGSNNPPDYPLEKIKVPLVLFSSIYDRMVDYKDVVAGCKLIPSCSRVIFMKDELWAHTDFIFATHVREKFIRQFLRVLDKITLD